MSPAEFYKIPPTNPHIKHVDLKTFITSRPNRIIILAQNVMAGPSGEILMGAVSGQESYLEISRVGGFGSILGHSEVRANLGDDDLTVRNKFLHMIQTGSVPLVCVGELFNERFTGPSGEENSEDATKFVTNQVKTIFGGLDPKIIEGTVIAYEPRWAIGTGKSASTKQIQEVHDQIRTTFAELYGQEVAKTIRILYGGSANLKNVKELFSIENVDGFLVGGASADVKEFNKMGEAILELIENEKIRTEKKSRLPILAGNLKIIRRDLDDGISREYASLNNLERKKLQIILAPPNTLIQEFANAF